MSETTTVVITDLGVTRLFGDCDLGCQGFTTGWSVPEQAHLWNDGFEAMLDVMVENVGSACRLTFEGEPFLSGECTCQDVILYVNGFRLGFWRLTEARTYSLSVAVEQEQLFARGDRALARCVWHLPQSVRPADLGLGGDSRQLGFCFRSLTLAPLSPTWLAAT